MPDRGGVSRPAGRCPLRLPQSRSESKATPARLNVPPVFVQTAMHAPDHSRNPGRRTPSRSRALYGRAGYRPIGGYGTSSGQRARSILLQFHPLRGEAVNNRDGSTAAPAAWHFQAVFGNGAHPGRDSGKCYRIWHSARHEENERGVRESCLTQETLRAGSEKPGRKMEKEGSIAARIPLSVSWDVQSVEAIVALHRLHTPHGRIGVIGNKFFLISNTF